MTTKRRKNGLVSTDSPAIDAAEKDTSHSADGANQEPNDQPVYGNFAGVLTRVTWFLAGPMALFLVLCGIASSGGGWLAVLDVVYFAIVGLIVWCRWLEQRAGRGATIYGEPTTWKDFRRYLAIILPLFFGAWVIANLLGNHLLKDVRL